MKKMIVSFLFSAAMLCVSAADLVTKSGTVLKGYALAGAAPNGIYVFHSKGVAVVPVKEFPDSMKEEIARIAKGIPEARRKAAARQKARNAKAAAHTKRAKAEAARLKKSAAFVKKEQAAILKQQQKLKSKSKPSTAKFSKSF